MQLQAQPSIDDARTNAVLSVLDRFDALDLSQILVYRIDSVPASALPWLAWQFDLLSPFWVLLVGTPLIGAAQPGQLLGEIAGGDAGDPLVGITDIAGLTSIVPLTGPGTPASLDASPNLRELLKIAIQLHRLRGTPWAIKTALNNLGFPGASLLEGQAQWGGTGWPSSQGWAVNRIVLDLAQGGALVPGMLSLIQQAFEFFKPARSWLDLVVLQSAPLSDSIAFTDLALLTGTNDQFLIVDLVLTNELGDFAETMLRTPRYDASYQQTGFEYGPQAVGVTDGALTVNGVAVEG